MRSPRFLLASRSLAGSLILLGVCLLSTAQDLVPTVTFKGHTEPIYSVAFSPDGTLVATGSFDKTVKLWDAKTGKELRVMGGTAGHTNIVLSVAFSPTGDSVASGGSDNFARVWDIPVNSPVKEFVHTAGVNAVAVSADGKMLAGAGKDGAIKIWTTADGKQTANLVGHPGGATGVAFSTNGLLLVSSGADSTIRYWNPVTGLPLGQVGAHASGVNGTALHPNGTTAYSIGEDGLLKFWQLPPVASRALPAHPDAVTAFFLSADGGSVLTAGAEKIVKLSNVANGQLTKDFPGAGAPLNVVANNATTVVAGGSDGKLYLWNPADGKLTGQSIGHTGGITGLAFHPAQPVLTTVGADGNLKTWSLPIPAPRSIATPDRVLAAVLSANGQKLYTAGADKIARSWTMPAGMAERQFAGHTGPVTALAITADGATLVTAGADETIRFWNTSNSTQIAQFSGHVGGITSLSISGTLLASAGEDGTVKLWQLPPIAAKPFAHPDAVNALTLSADGKRAVTIGNDKQARVWVLATGQMERSHSAGTSPISAVAIAPDNVTMAVAGADKSLSIWNAGKEVRKFPPLAAIAQSVAFSPNGAAVAVGRADNAIQLLTIAEPMVKKDPKGKEPEKEKEKILAGHTGPITALMYNPKGDLLISASADKTVRLWNAADGAAKGSFTHTGPIAALALSKDGTRLAVGGADKTISMWTLADSKPAGTITTPAEVRGLSISPDGLKIAAAGSDGKVRIYGIDGKLQEAFVHEGPVTGVAFLPEGNRLISSSADKTARVWTSAFIAQGNHVGPVRQVFVTPTADRVFSAGDDKNLRIWDAKTAKEIKAIAAHTAAVVGFGLSTDLTKVVTAGADKMAKVWTIADGKAITTIALPGPAQAVTLSPNALKVAVAFADPAVRVRTFDAVSGQELQTIADPTAPVRSLFFLADNRTLVNAGDDKTVSIHDASVQTAMPIHVGGATGIALNPAGTQAITAGKDKAVKLWDLATRKELKAFGPLADPVNAVAVSKDFTLVGAAGGKIAKVWQMADAKEIATLTHPAEIVALAFNTDKSRIVTGATDNLARVWEVATGRLLQTFSHGATVRGVAFHPTQPLVITASADKTTIVHTQSIVRAVPASTMPLRALSVLPNGTHLITGGDDMSVKGWNNGTGVNDKTFAGATGPVYAVAASKNSQLIAAAGADKTIRIYTFADAKLIGTITAPSVVRGLAFHPTLPMLTAAGDDKSINAWNIAFVANMPLPPEFGKPIQSFTNADVINAVTFAEKGELYSASSDKTVKQWRIASDAPSRNFQHPNLVDAVAFNNTGKLLATGCHDGILRIYDLEKNAVAKQINAHVQPAANQIYTVVWTPDGKQILSGSYDRSLKLWDATAGTMIREFKPYTVKTFEKGHRDQIFCAAFTKDGKFLATGSSDKMLKIWNTADGTVVREFANPKIKQLPAPASPEAHPGWIYGVRYSLDEKHLISVGSGPKNTGFLAVWNVADGKLLFERTVEFGPIYSLAMSKDGTQLLLGCGSKNRMMPISDAIIVPMPVK